MPAAGASTAAAAAPVAAAPVAANAAPQPQPLSAAAKAIITKLQSWVYQRHIKPHPFFFDFDKLRSYRIPPTQFVRGLTLLMHGAGHNQQLTRDELALLCAEFAAPGAKVNWKAFADAVDEVFAPTTQAMAPTSNAVDSKSVLNAHKSSTLSAMKTASLAAQDMISNIVALPGQHVAPVPTAAGDDNERAPGQLSPSEQQLLDDALDIIRTKVRTKRILVKTHLQDFDRQNRGHISRTQFLRCLKVMELSFADNIMQLLLWKYASVNHPLDVHWKAFAADVDPDPIGASAGEGSFAADAHLDALNDAKMGKSAAPKPELNARPETPVAVHDANTELQDLMARIQSKLLRRRQDINAVFQQFDPLRSGRIAANRFRASLNVANLIALTDAEYRLLVNAYRVADVANNTKPQFAAAAALSASNRFSATAGSGSEADVKIDYVSFVQALERVFTEPGLHLKPRDAPKGFTPVNEGYQDVDARQQGLKLKQPDLLFAETLPLIRAMRDIIYTRRIHPKQFFTQHDRHHTGCVTVGKFEAIVKGSLGFQIGADDWANLVNRFRRDATHVRYVEFCEMLNTEPPTSTANRDAAGFSDDIERDKQRLASIQRNPDASPRVEPLNAHSLKAKSSTFLGGNAGAGNNVQDSATIVTDDQTDANTVLAQLRVALAKRRMDISDLFNDFDRLRTGRLPIATFRRAMDGAQLSLSSIEVQALMSQFRSQFASDWIDYTAFLAALDLPTHLTGKVLTQSAAQAMDDADARAMHALASPKGKPNGGKSSGAGADEQKGPAPIGAVYARATDAPAPDAKEQLGLTFGGVKGAAVMAGANRVALANALLTDEEKLRLSELMQFLGAQIHTRGMLLKPHFQDYDRSRCGRVNAGRFKAVLSLHPMNLSQDDFALLIKRFELGGPGVSYAAFLDEISKVETHFAHGRLHTPRTRALIPQPLWGAVGTKPEGPAAGAGEGVGGAPGAGKSSSMRTEVLVIGSGKDSARKESDAPTVVTTNAAAAIEEGNRVGSVMPSITTAATAPLYGPLSHADLLHRLQTNVVQKRVAVREAFADFDPLRKGVVSESQFVRVLKLRGLHVTDHELDVLFAAYGTVHKPVVSSVASAAAAAAAVGAQVAGQKQVHYARFCDDLDLAVTDNRLITNPSLALKNFTPHTQEKVGGDLHRHTVRGASDAEAEEAKELVRRLNSVVVAKRLFIKPMFLQHDKHHRGSVMRNRFGGVLKDAGIALNDHELDVVERAYRKEGDRIDYVSFVHDLYRGQLI